MKRVIMSKKARIAAIVLCIAMLALSAAACKSQDQIEEQKNIVASTQNTDGYYDTRSTVKVTGTGTVSIKPDIAKVGFTVRAQEKDVSDAQQQNAKLMEAVLEVIKAKGIAEEDIDTGYLNINEVRDYSKNPAKVVGYEVYYTVNVTVRDMDVLGSLISCCRRRKRRIRPRILHRGRLRSIPSGAWHGGRVGRCQGQGHSHRGRRAPRKPSYLHR